MDVSAVPADQRFRLLGLSGSLRAASNSSAILRSLAARLSPDTSMQIFDLNDLPMFNEDIDTDGGPPVAQALRTAVRAADGIVVVTPEYNHGIPGVMKNAIDWASRPGYDCPLKEKPVKIMTVASSALGGARAQAWLQESFVSTLSRVVPGKQVIIGSVESKVKDGVLVHEDTALFALDAIDQMIEEICLFQRRPKRVIPAAWVRPKPVGRGR